MLTHDQAREQMRLFAQQCEREEVDRIQQLKACFSDERNKGHETARVVVEYGALEGTKVEGWLFHVLAPSEIGQPMVGGVDFVRASDGAIFSLGSRTPLEKQAKMLPKNGGWRDQSQPTSEASGEKLQEYPKDASASESIDRGKIRWSVSFSDVDGVPVQEDGVGVAPCEVRKLLIRQHGRWRVSVDDPLVVTRVRRLLLKLFQLGTPVNLPGCIYIGTVGEAELLVSELRRLGSPARSERTDAW